MDDLWCGEKDMGTKESVSNVAPHIHMKFLSELIQFMFEAFIKFGKRVVLIVFGLVGLSLYFRWCI